MSDVEVDMEVTMRIQKQNQLERIVTNEQDLVLDEESGEEWYAWLFFTGPSIL